VFLLKIRTESVNIKETDLRLQSLSIICILMNRPQILHSKNRRKEKETTEDPLKKVAEGQRSRTAKNWCE
jgi:hypothetical protein